MAKAPDPTTVARSERPPDDTSVTIVVDERRWTIRLGDITARQAGTFRQTTGHSLSAALHAWNVDPDIDLAAEFAWFARRFFAGEAGLRLAEVQSEITYDSRTQVTDDPSEAVAEEPDSPEG